MGARLLTYGGILLIFGGVIINYIPNRVRHGRCFQQQTVNMFAWIFFTCKGVLRRMRRMSRVAL